MPFFTKTLVVVCLAYAGYCLFLFVVQRQMMFPRYAVGTPPTRDLEKAGIERIWIDTPAGKVESWYLPSAGPGTETPSPAVIVGHGNAELIDYGPAEFRRFARLGLGVLFVEFPGYGRSKGTPSQKSITQAFIAAYDRLAARTDVDADKIVLFGRSMGGGAVCALAENRPSVAMILQSTFTSTRPFARRYLAPGFLMRDPFDNLSAVKRYDRPLLVIHGRRDDIIPHRQGEALAAAAENGRMITYDCGHNDCPPDAERFWGDVEDFLQEAGVIECR